MSRERIYFLDQKEAAMHVPSGERGLGGALGLPLSGRRGVLPTNGTSICGTCFP